MLFDAAATAAYQWLSSKSVPGIDLWVEHPDREVAVVRVVGDLDEVTTPQLAELLAPRLRAAVGVVVLDLARVSFLGTEAMRLLLEAQQYAEAAGVALRLVTGPPAVDRALRAAELTDQFAVYPALGLAVWEPAKR